MGHGGLGDNRMTTEALKSARVVAFIFFAVMSLLVIRCQPGSLLALLIPAMPLFTGVGFSFVIKHREGWTVAKRAEWFEKNLGRTDKPNKKSK
jgi:hypothetical protein